MLSTVISLKPQGENNSNVCLLTQTEGIMYATLYGGHKSRLKGLCSPWNTGTVWLSQDTKTGFYKISDFSVNKYHLTFRENLTKYYASSLAAELGILTKCAGNSKDFWALFNGFIDGLDICTEESQCKTGLIRFLWRFLSISGIQPDSLECSGCGKSFLKKNISVENSEKSDNENNYDIEGVSYSVTDSSFYCGECRKIDDKTLFFLNPMAISYLSAITSLSPAEARNWPLNQEALVQIEELLFFLIESSTGKKLKTLKSGRAFL